MESEEYNIEEVFQRELFIRYWIDFLKSLEEKLLNKINENNLDSEKEALLALNDNKQIR